MHPSPNKPYSSKASAAFLECNLATCVRIFRFSKLSDSLIPIID